jgi:molybdopterin/thiamine biosynthesis adenylyltransferase
MAHVVIVGAGTIGSHVVSHVARRSDVTRITVVDPDTYAPHNIRAQEISPADVGKLKADVQARRVTEVNPKVVAQACPQPVEALPLGWLRGDVILSCVDSRRARMAVNQAAWRLGVPWINAGIDAAGLLARVQVFRPGRDVPCLECAWDQRDYELVEQTYPCQDPASPAPTGATSGLGALAAAIQGVECDKLLDHDEAGLLDGRDVLIDARHHRHFVTEFRRNPVCRMPDHVGWSITPLAVEPSSTPFDELLTMAGLPPGRDVRMSVAGQQWVPTVTCDLCDRRVQAGWFGRAEPDGGATRCADCGGMTRPAGFDVRDAIAIEDVNARARTLPIALLGLVTGDVLTFTTSGVITHLELVGEHAEGRDD